MSTHKHFDRICCVVLALVIVVSVLFVNGERLGIKSAVRAMEYENSLFDTSYVHSINIVIDDWDSFLETCTNEQYTACSVVIDDEAFKNVAIRAKGNTSLTQVRSYGNNRYSFKIEFDAYDSTKTYHGLDKLCLNNIIQDNTYLKDYLTYRMMNEFGVASPLCSFVYITVNGEDWGLYLAVEGVEDSFLQRNYGSEDGELYKPDSQSMGGGRGNGKGFDMDEAKEKFGFGENDEKESTKSDEKSDSSEQKLTALSPKAPADFQQNSPVQPPDGFGGGMGGMQPPDSFGGGQGGMTPPDGFGGGQGGMTPPNGFGKPDGNSPEIPDGEMPEMPDNEASENSDNKTSADDDNSQKNQTDSDSRKKDSENRAENGGSDFRGGGMSMKSDDVSLIYSDDEFSSYSNIFNNAKTDIEDSDKKRLISSIKNINENINIDSSVDIEAVIRYFVVHNFVLNFDSYTGSMIHNYYLYETDGKLSMIPWDYNLAFGGFQSMGGAQSLVNYPIDSPVSGGTAESRPMLNWIFENEEYTERYHKLFGEFIKYFTDGDFEKEIDSVTEMISPYVKKDPTKFCTYEEFEKGSQTLKSFCLLRAESISGQLDGTIGLTSEAQTDKTNFVSADGINISDMGSMNGGKEGKKQEMKTPDSTQGSEPPQMPEGEQGEAPPQMPDGEQGETPPQMPDGEQGETPPQMPQERISKEAVIISAVSTAVLIFGIIFALLYKRRKR